MDGGLTPIAACEWQTEPWAPAWTLVGNPAAPASVSWGGKKVQRRAKRLARNAPAMTK